eukprot:776410-Prymnesium_polylepis.1
MIEAGVAQRTRAPRPAVRRACEKRGKGGAVEREDGCSTSCSALRLACYILLTAVRRRRDLVDSGS